MACTESFTIFNKMVNRIIKVVKKEWLFLLLISIAGGLRFYQLGQIPFHHDELSALSRLQFDGLPELLKNGVEPDFHPAFTQVFLYFWAKIFGIGHIITRLPFIISSLGAITILYVLQKELFGKAAANAAVGIIAVAQLFIYDSVMARPYAFGLLFTSALAYFTYKTSQSDRHINNNLTFIAILLALTAYTHYFAVVLGAIIYLSGFVLVTKGQHFKYLLSGAFSLVFFLPHIGLTLAQFSRGGIGGADGWLGEPEATSFIRYLLPVTNDSYSALVILMMGAIIGVGFCIYKKQYFGLNFFIWPVLIYLFGYYYSIQVNPIMHEQGVIFALQFFILGATCFLKTKRRLARIIIPVSIVFLGVFNLKTKRNHFDAMKSTPFAWIAQEYKQDKNALMSIKTSHQYVRRYATDFPDSSQNTLSNLAPQNIATRIENSKATRYIGDGLIATAEVLAAKKYPQIKLQKNGVGFYGYVREKGAANAHEYGEYILQEKYHGIDSTEYLTLYKSILTSDWDMASEFLTHIEFEEKPSDNLVLVVELRKNNEPFVWRGSNVGQHGVFFKDKFVLVNGTLLWDACYYPEEVEGLELIVYVWNPEKKPFRLVNAEIYLRMPNHNRYGLLLPRS